MALLPVINMLEQAGFISTEQTIKLADACRDNKTAVFLDQRSGVIFLDPAFSGKSSDYYAEKAMPSSAIPRNDMDHIDTTRRSSLLRPLIAGKRWLDFGCGPGYQLRQDSRVSAQHLGIELNNANRTALLKDGYQVAADIDAATKFSPDVISLFHVMEHLADPLSTLKQLSASASDGASLIVEVPHARDWLLQHGPESFKAFTLWSEHIVLHTRQSLAYVLERAGWQVQHITAAQRYPVWNHLQWCLHNKPTGFNAASNDASSMVLHQAYEHYLAQRDQTDTLIAVAKLECK